MLSQTENKWKGKQNWKVKTQRQTPIQHKDKHLSSIQHEDKYEIPMQPKGLTIVLPWLVSDGESLGEATLCQAMARAASSERREREKES